MLEKLESFLVSKAFLIALFMFTFVLAFYLYYFHGQVISEDVAKWGVFGDFIGGTLNPFLSFLALVILLRTFSIQKTELDLQKEELKDTKELLKLQTQTQVKQQFESTFFALLNVHNQLLQDLNHEPIESSGFNNRLERQDSKVQILLRHIASYNPPNNDKNIEFFELHKAKRMMLAHHQFCGNYFLVLYQVLKFIETNAPSTNKKMYSNMVRALLTDEIMQLLAINCYYDNEEDTYKEYFTLVEKYAIFEHASFNAKSSNYSEPKSATLKKVLEEARGFYKEAFGL